LDFFDSKAKVPHDVLRTKGRMIKSLFYPVCGTDKTYNGAFDSTKSTMRQSINTNSILHGP